MILEQQIVVVETTLEGFFYDVVVTMVFTFVVERALPRVAILQFAPRNNFYRALRQRDDFGMRHKKKQKLIEDLRRREDEAS